MTKQQKLAERLEQLGTAAEGWRKRVAVSDAVKFSVAGKMKVEHLAVDKSGPLSHLIEVAANGAIDGKKKLPRPERFRSCKSSKNLGNSNAPGESLKVPDSSPEPGSEESGKFFYLSDCVNKSIGFFLNLVLFYIR